jgi:hypothetical protein
MQRGCTSRVGRALRTTAIGLVVATIGVGLVGGVAIAQASSESSAAGPAGTPHNDKAYIFDEFGLVGGDTDILKNIDAGLTDEGYKVTFLRDQTEGAGSPGSATLGSFEAMAKANPGIVIINTHGTDWSDSSKECGGKGVARTYDPSAPHVCPTPAPISKPPPTEAPLPVLQVQWFSSYAAEVKAYRDDLAQPGFKSDWLYPPTQFNEASTLIPVRPGDDQMETTGENGRTTVSPFGYRPYLGLTSLGIAHFFAHTHVELVNNWACHSMSVASSFHAASYTGYTDRACVSTEQPDQKTLWNSLLGLNGVPARSTTGAFNAGQFLDRDLKLQPGSKPIVLSPAVSSSTPAAGTVVASGSTVTGSVSFDTPMVPSTANIIVPSGCDATVAGTPTWNSNHNKLSFSLNIPADAAPGPLTLDVPNTAARAKPGGYVHDRLDGAGLGIIPSGVVPNRTDYLWRLQCGPTTSPSPPDTQPQTPPNPLPTPEPTPSPAPVATAVPGYGVTVRIQGNYTGDPLGYGAVTVSPEPPVSSGLGQYMGLAGCTNLRETIEDCEAGGWTSPVSVKLTASAIPEGTSGVPNDSYFVGWGGDCAGAGTSPTCTLSLSGWDDVEAIFQGAEGTLG